MSKYKVSVIVPIFGVERYIERCARTLMEQSLDNIQFIFVNDATQDRSMDILRTVIDEYPQRQEDVLIIEHDVNKGLPAARHTGLAAATGDYIIHCDSDDHVDLSMYELMYKKAKSEDLDIVISDIYEGSEDNWVIRRSNHDPNRFMDDLLNLYCALWNKMIRAEIAKTPSVVIPLHNMAEDLAVIVQYALMTEKIGFVEQPLYYYDRHTTSILGNRSPEGLLKKQLEYAANFDIAVNAIRTAGKYLQYKDLILHQRVYIKNYILPALPHAHCYMQWKNTYPEVNSKVLFSKMFTLREKANFIITYLGLYPTYYKLTHRNA